ncbi:MAG: hypothetical protein HOP18_11290 [Deltaproteobacteria bacterium]|nr:hypothetical protein [Deltaproteobacteria bacterium]
MKPKPRCVWLIVIGLVCCWDDASLAQMRAEREEIVRFGEDITVTAADVLDTAVAIGGSITVLSGGQVTQSVVAIGGDVTLNTGAQIDGDVVVIGGEIRKDEGVRIGGKEVVIAGGVRDVLNTIRRWGPFGLVYRLYVVSVLLHLGVMLLLAASGALLILLLPEPVQTIAATLQREALKSGVWGVGGLLLGLLLLGLTIGSLLGLLLVPPLLLIFALIGVLGSVASAVFLGDRVFTSANSSLLRRFLLGVVLLGLSGLLPVIGKVVCALLFLFGCGAVLVSRGGRRSGETTGQHVV